MLEQYTADNGYCLVMLSEVHGDKVITLKGYVLHPHPPAYEA